MKAVLIVHNSAVDDEVNQLLSELGLDCYTKFTNVLGRGKLSDPHLDSPVWPEANNATFVVTEPEKARQILTKITQLRSKLGSEGVKAFSWQIEQIT